MIVCASSYVVSGSRQAFARSAEGGGQVRGSANGSGAAAPRSVPAVSAPGAASSQIFAFEANRGQFAEGVAFVAHGGGLTAALGADAVSFSLGTPATGMAELRMRVLGRKATPVGSDRLPGEANYLTGSDPSAWITGVPLYGRIGYADVYPGIDVVYGSDTRGRLQYDFIVDPGADPGAIRLAFEGATSLTLDADGNLIAAAAGDSLVQTAPVLYQVAADGEREDVAGSFQIDNAGHVGFQVGDYDRLRPLVIDPVSLSYSTFLGTDLGEEVRDVASDAAGNSYVVGTRTRPSFFELSSDTRDAFVAKYGPTGSLVYLTYVFGTTGSPVDEPFLLAAGNDDGDGIAAGPISTTDPTIVAYITGWTTSTDFPIVGPAFQTSLTHDPVSNPRGARQNAFLVKLNAQGNGLLYSTYIGRSNFGEGGFSYRGQSFPLDSFFEEGLQHGRDVAVDAYAVAYVVGDTLGIQRFADSVDGPPRPNDPFHISDAFLHRVNLDSASAGYGAVALRWNLFANHAPGLFGNDYAAGGGESATGVALSPDRDVFVTGHTGSTDLYTSHGALQTSATANLGLSSNPNDAFVVQFDGPDADLPDDTGIVGGFEYATYLGGGGDDQALGIAVDPAEHAFVTGGTTRDSFPTTAGAYQRSSTSEPILEGAAFVSKLNEAGSVLAYSTLLGGNSTVGVGIALDDLSRAYVVGHTLNQGTFEGEPPSSGGGFLIFGEKVLGSFPLTDDATDASDQPGSRAYLTALNPDGSGLLFSTFHGSRTRGQGVAVRLVKQGAFVFDREAVVVGSIDSGFMPVVSADQDTPGGLSDGFVAKWSGFGIQ